ncbi:hypothetical protein FHT76_004528 [Rhizobium sp. BK176]|nr:hypothetical protein [Rhizobium sp. BK399]MCS3741534.1 hypothetical protein [Rhizobium sp. BK661]MCS4092856.1 hypothetical protein [Rhizobium sp. BK176]
MPESELIELIFALCFAREIASRRRTAVYELVIYRIDQALRLGCPQPWHCDRR